MAVQPEQNRQAIIRSCTVRGCGGSHRDGGFNLVVVRVGGEVQCLVEQSSNRHDRPNDPARRVVPDCHADCALRRVCNI